MVRFKVQGADADGRQVLICYVSRFFEPAALSLQMGSVLKHVMTVMERIAPLRLAEKWDKVSQVSDPGRQELELKKAHHCRSGWASRGLA